MVLKIFYPLQWHDGRTFTWADGRRLASVTGNGRVISYTYNADGLRLTKNVNGTEHRYTWQGSRLISEYRAGNTLEFFYDESGRPAAFLYNGTAYYYVTNLQGDITHILDANGNVCAEYSYNAWGRILSASGTMAAVNPLRYRGYYYDAESGWYYLQSRYYDPEVCRFINADASIATSITDVLCCNMFAYCSNGPVLGYDPAGHLNLNGLVAGILILAATALTVATFGIATPLAALATAAAVTTGTVAIVAAVQETPIVLDVTANIGNTRAGLSAVVDITSCSVEIYSHVGNTAQSAMGPSYSTGIVYNYSGQDSYGGPFADISASFLGMGGGFCGDPGATSSNPGTKAVYASFSSPTTAIDGNIALDHYTSLCVFDIPTDQMIVNSITGRNKVPSQN